MSEPEGVLQDGLALLALLSGEMDIDDLPADHPVRRYYIRDRASVTVMVPVQEGE